VYAKLLSADVQDVKSILRDDRQDLQQQLKEEGEHSLDGSFITAALKSLDERERSCMLTAGSGHVISLDKSVELLGHTKQVNNNKMLTQHSKIVSLEKVKVRSVRAHKQYRSAFSDDEIDMLSCEQDEEQVDDLTSCLTSSLTSDLSSSPDSVHFEMDGSRVQSEVEGSIVEQPVRGVQDEMDESIVVSSGVERSIVRRSERCGVSERRSLTVSVSDVESESRSLSECSLTDKHCCTADQQEEEECERAREETRDERSNVEESDQNAFYFYQAEDGQQIYMNPLNIRCITSEYKSLSHAPDCITATILELESVSMDENVRRRLRVLDHLPLTCQFMMAELDLKPPIISHSVHQQFAEEIERRSRARQRKAREDRQRARRIQDEENRKLGIDPTVRVIRSDYKSKTSSTTPCYVVSQQQHDNGCQSVSEHSVVQHAHSASSVTTQKSDKTSESSVNDVLSHNNHLSTHYQDNNNSSSSSAPLMAASSSLPSFAQMLKAGQQRQAVIQASRQQGRPSSTGGVGLRRLSGTEDDEVTVVPNYEDSWAVDIQAALDSLAVHKLAEQDIEDDQEGAGGEAGGKKKKKKVKKLLFTTSMSRHN